MIAAIAEKTGPQVVVSVTPEGRARRSRDRYKLWREIRRDPTVSLVRTLLLAPVLASDWSVEASDDAPEGARELVEKTFLPMREHFQRTAVLGCTDYGWMPYEKVFDTDGPRWYLKKLKPLLQDRTTVVTDDATGAFVGLRQSEVDLPVESCLVCNFEVEGTDWYGRSQYESVEEPYLRWLDVDAGCERYERRIAGTHWVVHYPEGVSVLEGVLTDNLAIARRILNMLEASGKVAIPRPARDAIDELQGQSAGSTGWEIELLTDSGAGATTFIERMKYLDALKVRGMGVPERAVLEGQFGTKAEAGVHGDFAVTNIEMRHRFLVQQLNWHAVNQVLVLNWGPGADGTVRLVAAPIADERRAYLAGVYDKILTNPEAAAQELSEIDGDALRERLGVPSQPRTPGLSSLLEGD